MRRAAATAPRSGKGAATIRRCQVFRRTLRLRHAYAIAYEEVDRAELLFLRLETAAGHVGWGSAAPAPEVTGETIDVAARALAEMADDLGGGSSSRLAWWADRLERSHPASPSARAAVSIALHDLLGQRTGLPLYQILGHFRDSIPTSVTLGIADLAGTVRAARRRVAEGFRILKLKGGHDWKEDVERVRRVRRAVGPRVRIRFDANQGYSPADALAFLRGVGRTIELLEQPTHAQHLFALKEVTAGTPVPIMADESILSLEDSFNIARAEVADMVNLKLMKTGGIRAFLKSNAVAEAAGLETMVGCMDESRISVAAGLHLALAHKNVEMADLDGHLDLIGDPARGGVVLRRGRLHPVAAPGLGVEVDLSG